MSTSTPPLATRPLSDAVRPGPLRAVRQFPHLSKLLLLVLAAAVLVPLLAAKYGAAWPSSLTVDVSGPLGKTSDWIIDNRDSHWLFVYFLGHLSNAVVISVRAVYMLLLALGWTGVTAGITLIAWRVAGVRIAATALISFLASGLLGMWVPTMQTLALMVVAVVFSVVVGALLAWPAACPSGCSASCARSWTPCRCSRPSPISCPSCWSSASASPPRCWPPSSTRLRRWPG